MRPRRRHAGLILFLALVLSCSPGPEQAPERGGRPFRMGLTYWPPAGEATSEAVVRRELPLLLQNTEVVHVQIPWCPARRRGQADWLGLVARQAGHHLAISLDWLADHRTGLRCGGREEWTFADSAAAAAFEADAAWLAHRYRPEYLILGVEVDYYALAEPDDFRRFLTAYRRARDRVEKTLPTVRVGVSVQYEHAQGVSGPEGTLLQGMGRAFDTMSDFIGLSVYPFMMGLEPEDVGTDYFEALTALDHPVLVTETAWPGMAAPEQQRTYAANLLEAARAAGLSLVVWTSAVDVEQAAVGADIADWAHKVGLWDRDGRARPAHAVWRRWLEEPRSEGGKRPQR